MNVLSTLSGLVHKTDAAAAEMRTMAKPECGKRAVAGWVGPEKPLQPWERHCPKCFK